MVDGWPGVADFLDVLLAHFPNPDDPFTLQAAAGRVDRAVVEGCIQVGRIEVESYLYND